MTPEEQKRIDEARAIANATPGACHGIARPHPRLRAAMRFMNGIQEGGKIEIPLSKAMDQGEAISRLADKLKPMLAQCGNDPYLLAAMIIKAENDS